MSYATPADLANAYGADEMAQRSMRGMRPDAALLQATIDGADRSAWTSAQQAEADLAVTRLQTALDAASAEADDYLRAGRYALPPVSVPASLARRVLDLARYALYEDRRPEAVRQGYEDALDWLKSVAAGRVVLDLGQPAESSPTASAGSPQADAPPRTWTKDTLDGF